MRIACGAQVSVVSCAVNVVCELARKNPANFLSLAPIFFKLLTASSNNWYCGVLTLGYSRVLEGTRGYSRVLTLRYCPYGTVSRGTPGYLFWCTLWYSLRVHPGYFL